MKVYERLASAFVGEGVSTIFGMMGDGNMYWMEALDKLGVKMLEVRHEGVGCGMADGWARATHTPGVCTATCGPGVSQLATGLLTANRANSPLVAFVGEYPFTDEEYIQRLNQEPFAAACESGFIRINSPTTVDESVRKAFYLAKTESRPIMLSAPMNVQQMKFDDDDPYRPSPKFPSAQGALQPDAKGLEEAANMIAASRKPVIIVGRGAIWSDAGAAIKKLAQRTGALITTSLYAKGWLSEDDYHVGVSGTYSTRTAMQLFSEADCVIAVGASLNRYTIMGHLLYPNARYVHIDTKANVMMGGSQFAECYLQADARAGVEALDALLAKRSFKSNGFRTAEVKAKLVNHYADPDEFLIEPGCVDPRDVCIALDEMMPSDVGLLTGSGASSGFTNSIFHKPRSYTLAGKAFGCVGQGLPAAMGAVVATNKPALLVDGDASVIMHLSDFDTAVRYSIPLLVVVLNDQALGAEYHKLNSHHMKAELSIIPTPDLGAVARAFGGRGALARSVEEVRTAAAEWKAKPGPMIIDARISRNVMSLSHRRVHQGKDV